MAGSVIRGESEGKLGIEELRERKREREREREREKGVDLVSRRERLRV